MFVLNMQISSSLKFFLNFAEFSCFCLFSLFRNISDLSSLATSTLYNGIFHEFFDAFGIFRKWATENPKQQEYSSLSKLIIFWKIANGFEIKENFLNNIWNKFLFTYSTKFLKLFFVKLHWTIHLIFGGKPNNNKNNVKIFTWFARFFFYIVLMAQKSFAENGNDFRRIYSIFRERYFWYLFLTHWQNT